MKLKDNHSSSLVGEVLTESAQVFFGSRRHIEEMIQSFHHHIDLLRKKYEVILNHSALLNYLLVDQSMGDLFYKELNIPETIRAKSDEFRHDIFPDKNIRGWRLFSRYSKMLYVVYCGLFQSADEYQYGKKNNDIQWSDESETMIYYAMAQKMCEIINEEIEKVNCYHSPSDVLNFAGLLFGDASMKEQLGASSFIDKDDHLNRKLSFKPIDFEGLNLVRISGVPDPKGVRYGIDKVCKTLLTRHSDEARKRIETVMKKKVKTPFIQ